MNVSARVEYACLAVLQLAGSFGSCEPVRLSAIADEQGIPSRFLVQILQQLKAAGLISSTRGAAGGYRLVQEPSAITLAEVMHLTTGNDVEVKRSCARETNQARALLGVWNDVARIQHKMLSETTFQDLLDRSADVIDPMYYI